MISAKHLVLTSLIGISTLAVAGPDSNGVLYVNKAVNGGDGSGSSWSNAIPELGQALELTESINTSVTLTVKQIWVAQGTYTPTGIAGTATSLFPITARDNLFVMQKDVSLYGGFIGTESSISSRTLPPGSTILSGDIGAPDVDIDNCYHVLAAVNAGTATIDGLSIQDALADAQDIVISPGVPPLYIPIIMPSSITLNDVYMGRNTGAGLFLENSILEISNVEVSNNFCLSDAAGVRVEESTVNFTDVKLMKNHCNSAGAALGDWRSTVSLTNSIITGNLANGRGSGIHSDRSDLTLTNVTVSGNRGTFSDLSAGIWSFGEGIVRLRNCIVSGNFVNEIPSETRAESQGVIENRSSLIGNVYYDNEGSGTTQTAVAVSDIFVQPESAANAPTIAGDYMLKPGSFPINNGDIDWYKPGKIPDISNVTEDLNGDPRIINTWVDLGPYEYSSTSGVQQWSGYQ